MKTVLAACVVITLVACGREAPGHAPAPDPGNKTEKSVGKKGADSESAPTGTDPMKEGY